MTQFNIPAATLRRLSAVLNARNPSAPEDLGAIRVEHTNGVTIALATNHEIAVFEYLGTTTESDAVIHLNMSAINTDHDLAVTVIPEAYIVMPEDAVLWGPFKALAGWRKWLPRQPVEQKGFMYWDLFQVQTLLEASPSGQLVFPEVIDASKPVVIRDRFSDAWFAVFIPQLADGVVKAAELPEWVK